MANNYLNKYMLRDDLLTRHMNEVEKLAKDKGISLKLAKKIVKKYLTKMVRGVGK